MNSSDRANIQRVPPPDDNQRISIEPYAQKPKFSAWERVYFVLTGTNGAETLDGPYCIGKVVSSNLYTLCDEKGRPEKGGMVVREEQLKAAGN